MSDTDLVSTPEAASLLGVPEAEFSRLARALELEPARQGTKTQPRTWQRSMIEQLQHGPEGAELRGAVVRKEKVGAIRLELEARYPDWKQALRPAALALFNFNRLTKWATCSRLRRRELYDLKYRVVRLLYELGLCQEASLHTVAGTEIDCDLCEGAGQDWRELPCPRCGGRGVMVGDAPLEYVFFCFLVDGQWFEWHSPRKAVSWPFTVTEPGPPRPDWQPRAGEKPVLMEADADFLEAEAHLRFVLDKVAQEKEAAREAQRQKRWGAMRQEGLERQARLRAEGETGGQPPAQ
jgi:hypothetical protein